MTVPASADEADRHGGPAVSLRGITKRFGSTTVLHGVDFDLRRGEVHALCGANGSGKSTLMKIIYGVHRPTAGTVAVAGQQVDLRSPAEALQRGIAAVPQELPLVPTLSVAENIFFGCLPRRSGVVRWRQLRAQAGRALAEIDMDKHIDLNQMVGSLPLADRQLVSIARALAQGAEVVIFDEPTSSLESSSARQLFDVIHRLRDEGRAIAFISQRLDDIMAVANRVSVLRDGVMVGLLPVAKASTDTIAELMAGRAAVPISPGPIRADRTPVLNVTELGGSGRLSRLSVTVGSGEIVGIAGLPGSGAEEVLPMLFGRRPVARGRVELHGRPVTGLAPHRLVVAGMAYVSGDRASEGLVLGQTVELNLTMAVNGRARPVPLHQFRQRREAVDVIERLRITPPNPQAIVGTLSGGNQQKVVVGRWLLAGARLWLLDDPTRGVDVHARADIHSLIRQQVAKGGGAIMTSSDMAELLQVCDRVLVIARGTVIAELDPAQTSEHEVLALAGGARPTDPSNGIHHHGAA